MSTQFERVGFPSRANNIRALWAPVLFCPRPGSPENLIIGIAAASISDFHLAEANAWKRLHCLYNDGAETALLAARVALDSLKVDLMARGQEALHKPKPTFSGISLGSIREGEGNSLKQIATSWLQTLSSLYDAELAAKAESTRASTQHIGNVEVRSDRLPSLVLDYVKKEKPSLADFFNTEIREQLGRPKKKRAQQIFIAFSGSRLVANFATLTPTRTASTIDHIKRLMFDLELVRDREMKEQLFPKSRRYEMILKHQAKDDPHISETQFRGVLEVVDELNDQGNGLGIKVEPRSTVPEIGQHVVTLERAA